MNRREKRALARTNAQRQKKGLPPMTEAQVAFARDEETLTHKTTTGASSGGPYQGPNPGKGK